MRQIIEIIVSPQGNPSVQTLGYVGPSCREASRFIEEALGKQASERLTAEFHQAAPLRQDQRLQN